MSRVGAYRRIGTVDGIELHRGTKATQLGFPEEWPFSFIPPSDFHGYYQFIRRVEGGNIGAMLVADPVLDDPKTIVIVWLEVPRDMQGRDYGRKTVSTFERWAKESGYRTVGLSSRQESYPFWERLGYRLSPESVEAILDNRDLYTSFGKEELDVYMRQVQEKHTVPDVLFERHPRALPYPIPMEKQI